MEENTQLMQTEDIDNKTVDLANKILNEDDFDETKKMIQLFNLNQSKKNVIRLLKLSKLLDSIYDQMISRVEGRPGEFSNEDLIKYVNTIITAIDKANKSLDLVQEAPAISVGQINIVNTGESFDRESRERILNAVDKVLMRAKEAGINVDDYTVSEDENKTDGE